MVLHRRELGGHEGQQSLPQYLVKEHGAARAQVCEAVALEATTTDELRKGQVSRSEFMMVYIVDELRAFCCAEQVWNKQDRVALHVLRIGAERHRVIGCTLNIRGHVAVASQVAQRRQAAVDCRPLRRLLLRRLWLWVRLRLRLLPLHLWTGLQWWPELGKGKGAPTI